MSKKKRAVKFGLVFLANLIIKGILDLILTPFLMLELGYIVTLTITTLIYLFIGIASVWLYDYYHSDFMLIEQFKRAQYRNSRKPVLNRILRFILRWSKKGKVILAFVLGLKNNGLFVIYFRRDFGLYNGFAGRNIKLHFLLLTIFINLYWDTMVYFGLSLWKIFFKNIF